MINICVNSMSIFLYLLTSVVPLNTTKDLQSKESILLFGVNIVGRLYWRAHVDSASANLARFCYALRIIRDSVGIEAATTM